MNRNANLCKLRNKFISLLLLFTLSPMTARKVQACESDPHIAGSLELSGKFSLLHNSLFIDVCGSLTQSDNNSNKRQLVFSSNAGKMYPLVSFNKEKNLLVVSYLINPTYSENGKKITISPYDRSPVGIGQDETVVLPVARFEFDRNPPTEIVFTYKVDPKECLDINVWSGELSVKYELKNNSYVKAVK